MTSSWYQPPAPKPRRTSWKKALIGSVLGVALCCGGATVLGLVTDNPDQGTGTGAAVAPIAAPAGAGRGAVPTQTAKPKSTLKPKSTPRPKPKPKATSTKPRPRKTTHRPRPETGSVYYANCSAVRAAGAAPIRRGDRGYSRKLDRDGDGVACE